VKLLEISRFENAVIAIGIEIGVQLVGKIRRQERRNSEEEPSNLRFLKNTAKPLPRIFGSAEKVQFRIGADSNLA